MVRDGEPYDDAADDRMSEHTNDDVLAEVAAISQREDDPDAEIADRLVEQYHHEEMAAVYGPH